MLGRCAPRLAPMPTATATLAAICGVFGLLIGSFLNVVIWRVPRGESIVRPPSACPACGHTLRPYDNVPLLSWMLLRARCRDCGAPISARYPVVELTTGVLFALMPFLVAVAALPAYLWLAGAGVALVVVHDRPILSDCSGENVDALGRCRFLRDTRAGGIALLVAGGVLVAGGAVALALGTKRRRSSRLALGPGGTLALRF